LQPKAMPCTFCSDFWTIILGFTRFFREYAFLFKAFKHCLIFFEQLRRKILFIVRLQLVMRRNHAHKQCLRAVAAKRALQLATKADFSFFVRRRDFYFASVPFCTFLSHTRLLRRDCLNFASCLAAGGYFLIVGVIGASMQ